MVFLILTYILEHRKVYKHGNTKCYNFKMVKTKKYQDWKKDLRSLTDIVGDISQKINHIVEQTGQIYFALSCLDDIRKYASGSNDKQTDNGNNGYHNGYEDTD